MTDADLLVAFDALADQLRAEIADIKALLAKLRTDREVQIAAKSQPEIADIKALLQGLRTFCEVPVADFPVRVVATLPAEPEAVAADIIAGLRGGEV